MTKDQIKQLRAARNWTQSEMAEYFGADISTIWRWENWEPPKGGVSLKALEREFATLQSEAGSHEGTAA